MTIHIKRGHIRDNLSAIVAPAANDDIGSGYTIGSIWINVSSNRIYICVDNALGAAIWDTVGGLATSEMTLSADPALNAAVTTTIIDAYSGVIIALTGIGDAQTLQSPTDTTAGKKRFTVVVKGAFDIEVNGITMTGGEAQRFIWDGASWVAVTAVDADDITFTPAQGLLSAEVQAAIGEAVKKQTIPIKEENVSALKKGQVVCATGASDEKVKVGLCDCTDPNKIRIMGLVSTDLVQNASGHSVFKGELPDVDTRATNLAVNPNGETWAEGALLWAIEISGGMSHNRPTSGRSIIAAISRKGSCEDDILQAISHVNPIWMTAASGEDIVLRMGDSAGGNKVSGRDYADNEMFSFDSDGNLSVKNVENNGGDLKIQATAQGDIILFGDTDVGDAEDGKSLYLRRNAVEGDDHIKISINQYRVGEITSDRALEFSATKNQFYSTGGETVFGRNWASGQNDLISQAGWITSAGASRWIKWQINDTTDNFELTRQDSNIGSFDIQMPVKISDVLNVTGNITTAGIEENITSHSATEAVTAGSMWGNIHKVTGAYTLTLPAAEPGMGGMFRASTAAVFSVKAGPSCHFEMIDGTVLDNGDKQTSGGTKNAWLHIHCETANVWITSGQHGTMEDTGA